jgi:cell division septation protein DedD
VPEPIISPGASRARRSVLETPPPPPRPRPRRSRLLLIGLPMLAVFAAFAAIVWLAYEDGAHGPPVGEPPLIAAAASPLKLAPGDPGGRVVANQGEVRELIGDEALPAGPERLLPLPEQPLTPLATTGVAEAADEGDPVTAPNGALGPAATPTGAAPSALAGLAEDDGDPPQSGAEGGAPQAEAALQALLEQVSRPPGATPPADATTGAAGAPPATSPAPPSVAQQEVRPAVAAPAAQPATPAPDRSESAIAAIAPGQPVTGAAQGAPAPAPAPQPAAQQPTQSAATEAVADRYRVQLAAVREEADARRAWDLFMIDLGPVLTRLQPYFERAETTNGVFYRVQAGPFATLDSAESVCTELKQRNASCFVVRR